MPASYAYLIIFVSAFAGWAFASSVIFFLFKPQLPVKILGFTIWGVLPALQNRFAKELASSISARYLQPALIASHLNNPALLQQLTPEIELHVDNFLEQKLPETFPLLAKLMGEKTLAKFKTAFLAEVEVIFPALVTSYSAKILEELHPNLWIENEIKGVSTLLLKDLIKEKMGKQLLFFKIIATVAGASVGAIQWLLITFIV